MPPKRLTIPDVLPRLLAYLRRHPLGLVGGGFHCFLDDGNYGRLDYEIRACEGKGDHEGAELGRLMNQLTRTQRSKIGGMWRRLL